MQYIACMKAHTLDKIDRVPLRERVYSLIQRAIVSGELLPGQRVRDVDLATQLGVSRTPVREALQRLGDEGLVETLPGALTRVVPLDMQAAQDAFLVVAVVHALATRLAVSKLTESDFGSLRQANNDLVIALDASDVVSAIRADDAFHEVFVRVSNNHEIQLTLDRLIPKVRRLEYSQFGSLAGHTSVLHHQAIIAACEQRQPEQAASLTEQNWLSLGQLIVTSFDAGKASAKRKDV
jgi:DNA-binding GntR family transcriptional regulator